MNLYRYVDMKPTTEGGASTLVLIVYPVVRETPKCWVIVVDGVEKRVLKGDGKRFAHEQHTWARYSFRWRKRFQLGHLRRQLAHTEKMQKLADEDFSTRGTPGEHFTTLHGTADKVEPFEGFVFG